jgi:hypothetical protein
VLELLPGETDLAVRLNLCEALLDHFSDEGIEPARQLIKQHGLTPDLRRLRSSLIAVCKIKGSRFHEFDIWQEEANRDAQEEWAKTQEIQKMAYEAGGDMALLVRKMKAIIAEQQAEKRRLEAEIAENKRRLAGRPLALKQARFTGSEFVCHRAGNSRTLSGLHRAGQFAWIRL